MEIVAAVIAELVSAVWLVAILDSQSKCATENWNFYGIFLE